MTSVGDILRTARETQGRAIAEVAEELCITQRYVSAIERNDLANLPGVFFYKSFARQYAAFLHLDEKLIEPGLSAMDASVEPASQPEFKSNEKSRQAPIRPLDPLVVDTNRRYFSDTRLGMPTAALIAMVVLCTGIFGWWSRRPERVSQRAAVQTPAPAQALPATSSETQAAPQPVAGAAALPEAPVADAPAVPLETASTAAPTVDVSTTTDGSGRVVLSLSATEKTWLSITSNGKNIFSGFLEPSQSKTLTGAENATMKVGNAGGLAVMWNGKPIGPIGPRGQVRTVRFTTENFEILSPSEPL
jgi:cytoskeletal protein RodZ